MCVEQLQESDNIININSTKLSKLTKFFIYYLLNVDKRIFEFYNSNIKLFLILINNKEEFMFIF